MGGILRKFFTVFGTLGILAGGVFLIMLMGGSRLAYRVWKENRLVSIKQLDAQPVLVLGAGDAGAALVKDLARSREWRVVGLLDDNLGKRGLQIHALPVLGGIDELPAVAGRLEVTHAIIDRAFGATDTQALWCANRVANSRGRRVIEKCGFQFRETGMVRSAAQGAMPVERYVLERRNWLSLKEWGAAPGEERHAPHDTAA